VTYHWYRATFAANDDISDDTSTVSDDFRYYPVAANPLISNKTTMHRM
jgi:hypothetical protein